MYVKQHYGNRYYAKAELLGRTLTAAYDQVLARADLLLMPTVTSKTKPLPGAQATREEIVQCAFETGGNPHAFDSPITPP